MTFLHILDNGAILRLLVLSSVDLQLRNLSCHFLKLLFPTLLDVLKEAKLGLELPIIDPWRGLVLVIEGLAGMRTVQNIEVAEIAIISSLVFRDFQLRYNHTFVLLCSLVWQLAFHVHIAFVILASYRILIQQVFLRPNLLLVDCLEQLASRVLFAQVSLRVQRRKQRLVQACKHHWIVDYFFCLLADIQKFRKGCIIWTEELLWILSFHLVSINIINLFLLIWSVFCGKLDSQIRWNSF